MAEQGYNDRLWQRIEGSIRHFEDKLEPNYKRWLDVYRTDTGGSGFNISPDDALAMNLSLSDMAEMRRYYFARLNLATSFIDIKTSALTLREPSFSVVILEEADFSPEKVLLIQSSLRRIWRTSKAQEAVRLADTYRRIFGYSLIKVAWDETRDGEGNVISEKGRTIPVSPTRILYDPAADEPTLQKMRWLAEVVWMDRDSLDAMRTNVGWKRTSQVGSHGRLNALSTMSPKLDTITAEKVPGFSSEESKRYTDEELFPIFLVWDGSRRKYTIMAASGKDADEKDKPYVVLHEAVDPYPFEDFYPFALLAGQHVPNDFHSIGDMQNMEPHLDLLARMFTIFTAHAMRSVPKYGYVQNAVTEQGRRALTESSVMAGVELRDGASANSVFPLQSTPLPDALIQGITRVEQYLNEAAGILDYHRGLMPGGRHTMGEVGQLVSLSGVRGQMQMRSLEEDMSALAIKLYDLYRFAGATVSVVQETPDGMRQPMPIPMADLPGAVELLVNSGSSAFSDRMSDRNDMMTLFQLLTQIPMVPPQSMPVLKHILGTFPQLSASDAIEILRSFLQAAMQQQQAGGEAGGETQSPQAGPPPGAEAAQE